jgi:uncharacterized C2H2 Zn-finger protein
MFITKKKAQCPYCGTFVIENRLDRHIKRVHLLKITELMEKLKSMPLPAGQVRCPYCGVAIKQERLDKHINKAHIPVE